jgi:3-dehydroquinate synthase
MTQPDIPITSSAGNYAVQFISNVESTLSNEKVLVVADSFFREKYQALDLKTFWIDAVEHRKNLGTVEEITNFMQTHGLKRDGVIVGLGGGVIQDLVTLAASIYMRGVNWVYVPTTLLGMVDSCIGGKSSINTVKSKNLLGNIYPPETVIIDTSFISSLSEIDIKCGLAEAAKIGYCKGLEAFGAISEILTREAEIDYQRLIYLTLTSKKWFIEIDEFDKNERLQLNFGHTFGHAIEKASDFKIPHGIGVALGMKCALNFNSFVGRSSNNESVLDSIIAKLVTRSPSWLQNLRIDRTQLIEAFRSDKKHSAERFSIILPTDHSGVEICKFDQGPQVEELITKAFDLTLREVGF